MLLESVAAGGLPLNVYSMLPPLQDRITSGDAKYWTPLLHNVVELALARNAVIWPVLSSSASLAIADAYASMGSVLIARDIDDAEQLRMLVKAGVVLMLPPARVGILLVKLQPQRMLTPESARPKLMVCPYTRSLFGQVVDRVFADQRNDSDHAAGRAQPYH